MDEISKHYGLGGLQQRIEGGFAKVDRAVDVDLLGAVDEFHVGGRPATQFLVATMDLGPEDVVLDVGSGLGGLARYIASAVGARVTGVDLTAEYIDVARWLTTLVGLDEYVAFVHGSAAGLREQLSAANRTGDDTPFSAATMLHVGMNIANKASVFAQVASLLDDEGQFAIYDLMATGSSGPEFPVPWAATPTTSFVESSQSYTRYLEAAGFTVMNVIDRTEAALAAMSGLAAQDGPPPLGLHLVMGPDTATKVRNLGVAINAGVLAPTVIRCTLGS